MIKIKLCSTAMNTNYNDYTLIMRQVFINKTILDCFAKMIKSMYNF